MNVYSTIIHKGQKVEIAHVYQNKQMDKQSSIAIQVNIIQPWKGSTGTCYNWMSLKNIISKKKSDTKGYIFYDLYKISIKGKSIAD